MNPNSFISFDGQWPRAKKWIIVTNNIDAENAHGEMSHVWMVNFCTKSSVDSHGIVTFDSGDAKIINLTHWRYA